MNWAVIPVLAQLTILTHAPPTIEVIVFAVHKNDNSL
jgi:hypothetical protein